MATLIEPVGTFRELFEAVQLQGILGDSKAFVDALPRSAPQAILERYRATSDCSSFDLARFVDDHFDLPHAKATGLLPDPERPVREHIERLWDVLARGSDCGQRPSSLIGLPHPYVVPGGRFREIYYWDSYFTLLGLAASGRPGQVENMVANFAYLIDTVGFVPNGNRSYFCSRSQPPFFALMVELLAELREDDAILSRYLPQLEKEHAFWMAGSDDAADKPRLRVVPVDGHYLNRYWDEVAEPRPESYAEDVALAAPSGGDAQALYRHLRAACESGWDFSSRWLADTSTLASIRTTDIVPLDLNALLVRLEDVLARAHALAGNAQRAQHFEACGRTRQDLIERLFFCERRGIYCDLLLPDLTLSGAETLATAYPLFLGLAPNTRAARVAQRLRDGFLRDGGWVVSKVNSGQQWDAPNGWAPLAWICYRGLCRYGFERDARDGARRWVNNNLAVYRDTGRLLEKYDVETIGRLAGGGEYQVQDGFGWTNGVLLCLLDELRM